MHAYKVTISIPQSLYDFVENYQAEHSVKSRSEVISKALELLQQKQLETYYAEANQELNDDFEGSANDGLEDEAW